MSLDSVNEQERPAQQNVFARLHALFPNAPSSPTLQDRASSSPVLPTAKVLKVRIVTWNMHDSVPKGDLTGLLGSVPPHAPSDLPASFLALPSDKEHPYHIVVVAGQECPSMSGIPMGLGAGFKFIDKDKDRDKEKERAKDRNRDYDAPRSKLKDKDDSSSINRRKGPEESVEHDVPTVPAYGWTSMIEDWLCSGTKSTPSIPGARTSEDLSAGDLERRKPQTRNGKGAYQLLVKERMMGLYLAVYVNRNIRGLVKGTSRSAVTAGLIGGRVGNKGGIGISINLDGTTLLFMNAHLAAHEGKVQHRLANLSKIKAELTVDDFLKHDDPRMMAEDITDKFDYTFLCGDLNFRLDISRLHADWLISRQEYAQALAFDQLRKLMSTGQAFVGFNEAPIDFPPTFKYDVLRAIKKSKRKSYYGKTSAEKLDRLVETEEKEQEDEGVDADEAEEGEAASIASSVWTSVRSGPATDLDGEDDDDAHPPKRVQRSYTAIPPSSSGKISISLAVLKAKSKWLALVSHSAPNLLSFTQGRPTRPPSAPITPNPDLHSSPVLSPPALAHHPHRHSLPASPKSSATSHVEEADADAGAVRGVYDSSHKKRVPSWCDRILWKSTVVPDPDPPPEDESGATQSRQRNRVGLFFANAFRPLRARGTSSNSLPSLDTPDSSSSAADRPTQPLPESPQVLDEVTPFSRFTEPEPKARSLHHSKSIDSIPARTKPVPSRSPTSIKRPRSASAVHTPSSSHLTPADLPPLVPPTANPNPNPNPVVVISPSRWRLFPFLGTQPSPVVAQPTQTAVHRKGEVVCLSYEALDDRGMRRLEGRSDHRPVIGCYAVYL